MKNNMSSLVHSLTSRINTIVLFLKSKYRPTEKKSRFVDLAPTDEADKTGVYYEAMTFATNNARVCNIALTGPYGSGKSSIIQTFLKRYRRRALHISLASFISGADSGSEKVSRQEIERSILQQMLYGADANKLPLSRFKRIQSPGPWAVFKSLYIMLGALSLWYVFRQREDIFSGTFFIPHALNNWVNYGVITLAAFFLWGVLHYFYVASFGLSLKSISLKDVEIKPASDDQASILNRHLDEIIYFFQSTDYDLVIIEDLDRFNDPEIFVTLREINSLVNENVGVKRTIRFLYALRDDMFVSTERTKFFEFIIPVIPIINTSNSIDMVLEQGRRLELDKHFDRQFLREVSRYLNDLRLIQSIFNEYAIYVANLESDGESLLDPNKLLAILIYKNAYPRDFERLHCGTGVLAEILNHKDELIGQSEAAYKIEITESERQLEVAERQTPLDLRELRQIYAMALIEMLPESVISIGLDQNSLVPLPQISSHEKFEQLMVASHLIYRRTNNQTQQFDVSKLQSGMGSQKSYHQRKKEIDNRAADNKSKALHQIRDLKSNMAALRVTKLNELLRLSTSRVQELFESYEENGELARFLILEGYLDDTYYQYTSLFHSGRLSPNDNKFLIQIRAFVTPEPGFQIDNPKEVIAAMRDEDFRQSYVLNVKLVDNLLSDRHRYFNQSQKLFAFLSSEFESCAVFLDAYYTSGHCIAELLTGLVTAWKDLVPAAISSPKSISHISQLVASLPEELLRMLSSDFDELPKFVSDNLPEILTNVPELAPERLKYLNFEVRDMAAIKGSSSAVRFMFKEGLFELTIPNLKFAYQEILEQNDLEGLCERNFTVIRTTNSVSLIKRIERDFERYIRHVLLELPGNSKEDVPAILAIISHENLDQDNLREFLKRQTTLLPSLENVPNRLHAMLFELNVIEPTWVNCLSFMKSDEFEAGSLVEYLDRDDVRLAILEHSLPSDSDSVPLRHFLIGANLLSDVAYQDYARSLPKSFEEFPDGLEPSKLRILIDERKVILTNESLGSLVDYRDLQVLFVAKNIDTYLADSDGFALDDGFREGLLRSEVGFVAKRGIVKMMDLSALVDLPERAALIGPIINSIDVNIPSLDKNVALSLIKYSRPVAIQISLFNKYHSSMTDDEVRQVLASLPEPFSEIKVGYKKPRLKNNSENQDLVRWLNSRNIISSWSEGKFLTDDLKVNLCRS